MRKSVALPFVGLALASVIAVGCSGSGLTGTATSNSTPYPVPTVTCTPPATTPLIQEVFPQNNSTMAANLQGIVIAVAPSPLPTGWFFYVNYNPTSSNSGTTYPGTLGQPFTTPPPVGTPNPSASATPTASPLPTPSDTPNFANPIYESASIGIFANSSPSPSTFTVYLANVSCYPGIQLSTFTTATVDTPTPTPTPTST